MNQLRYEKALAYIHNSYGQGKKNGLANMNVLLAKLNNPHHCFPSLHVAGTNGKGSVCAYLQAVLRCAGYHTALYTSPFLQCYNERIRIDGIPIPDEVLVTCMQYVSEAVDALRVEGIRPTEFEIGTALAFTYFARSHVDIAVIEVGLGGRLDPTNVIHPLVCGITSIGFDHMKVLGNTLSAIASEKAGIAKKGVPLILSSQVDEEAAQAVKLQCEAVGAPLIASGSPYTGELGLLGVYQRQNASVAQKMLEVLCDLGFSVPENAMREGFRRANWPGRLEWVQGTPPVLLDGAHNVQGAESLLHYVMSLPRLYTVLLFCVMQDKDYENIIDIVAKIADAVITVPVHNERCLDPSAAAAAFTRCGVHATACQSLAEGLDMATSNALQHNGRIVAAGSLYLVGELRTLIHNEQCLLLSEI